jgi:lysophospholipase L1-like esterase
VRRHVTSFIAAIVRKGKTRCKTWLRAVPADVVMLGDSLTHGVSWKRHFPELHIVNCGVGGDTTQHVLDRLDDVYVLQPRRVFLMIGVNDLNTNMRPETTLANYESIVANLRKHLPASRLFLQSVLPVNRRWDRARNVDIARLNEHIERLAKWYDSTFIDLHSQFCTGDGQLRADLSNDGLHLNSNGYALWSKIVRPLIGIANNASPRY